jgi:hypothetical protein
MDRPVRPPFAPRRRFFCGLAEHLGAEIFFRILQIEIYGDGDNWRAQLFWMRTDFDFGPNVTRTASARNVAPRNTLLTQIKGSPRPGGYLIIGTRCPYWKGACDIRDEFDEKDDFVDDSRVSCLHRQ